ncbi:internal scaffolding protein [Microviridae sp.]|nr:internal scaffolding protein [Microviridae sp.]
MAKFQRTGLIKHINEHEPQYGDVSGDTFYDSMLIVARAKSMFEELPSTVRREFDNDPGKFLSFVENPENEGKLIEMGLANQRESVVPIDDSPEPEKTTTQETAPVEAE